MSATIIRNGRVIDPTNKRDEVGDVYISDGKIVASKSEIRNPKSEYLKAGNPKDPKRARSGVLDIFWFS